MLLSLYSFLSLSFLLFSGWFVIAVCSSISVQGTILVFRTIVNWCRVSISNDKSTEWAPSLFVFLFWYLFSQSKLWYVDCGLSVWGKIMIPMYRLWLHVFYGLYGPHCLLSPERPLNLITHSLTRICVAIGLVWFIKKSNFSIKHVLKTGYCPPVNDHKLCHICVCRCSDT